jgi:hypothetical protein
MQSPSINDLFDVSLVVALGALFGLAVLSETQASAGKADVATIQVAPVTQVAGTKTAVRQPI